MKSRVYKVFSVMAVLIVITSIWYVKSNPHDYEKCAESAQIAAYDDLVLEAGVEPVTAARQAEYYQTIIDNQIKCSDLGAQWGTANVALLGYIAGLLGLVFLGITVFETQNAAGAARDTLKIAQETLHEARRTTALEMQPYLTCESIEVKVMGHSEETGIFMTTVLHLKNSGKTPAYITTSENRTFGSLVARGEALKAKPVVLSSGSRVYIGPGGSDRMLISSTFKFENYLADAVPNEFSILGDIHVIYYDDFTPDGKQKAMSFMLSWDKITRLADPEKVRLGRVTHLKMQNTDQDES